MKFRGTLIAVSDIAKSKEFYETLMGQKPSMDLGVHVAYESGLTLQTKESWQGFIDKPAEDISFGGNDAELYFEEDDLDSFVTRLVESDITFLHPLIEHSWGQRAIRFYDPDKHIIEVGENIAVVAGRFITSGMTIEQVAQRMDVPIAYVQSLIN